jgi:hypothetical protein
MFLDGIAASETWGDVHHAIGEFRASLEDTLPWQAIPC